MGSSPSVSTPKPSAQETQLLNMILNQLTEQQAYNDMMYPEYARQLGYKIVEGEGKPYEYTEADQKILDSYDKTKSDLASAQQLAKKYPHDAELWNKAKDLEKKFKSISSQYEQIQQTKETYESKTSQQLVKMSDEEWYSGMTDSEKRQFDLNKETQTRQLKALRGELPLTESLQQQKAKEFEQLKGTYGITGDDVNSAVATDTIGTQNLSEFKKRWGALEEQERYGQLSSGTGATVAMSGLTSDLTNRNIGSLSSLGGRNAGLTSGYYSLLQPYMAYTQAGYQAQAQNQLTQSQQRASLLGMAGMGASTGAMIGGPYGAAIGGLVGLGAGYFATR